MTVGQWVDLPYDSCVYEIKASENDTDEYVIEITSPFNPMERFLLEKRFAVIVQIACHLLRKAVYWQNL